MIISQIIFLKKYKIFKFLIYYWVCIRKEIYKLNISKIKTYFFYKMLKILRICKFINYFFLRIKKNFEYLKFILNPEKISFF